MALKLILKLIQILQSYKLRTLWIAGSLCRKEVVYVYIHKYTHTFIILAKWGFSTQTGGKKFVKQILRSPV